MSIQVPVMFETNYRWVVPVCFPFDAGNVFLSTLRLMDEVERVERLYGARFVKYCDD